MSHHPIKMVLHPSRRSAEPPQPPSMAHPSAFSIVTPILVSVAMDGLTDVRSNSPILFSLAVVILCVVSLIADYAGRYATYLLKYNTWMKKHNQKDYDHEIPGR